jgi:hypothetical protein
MAILITHFFCKGLAILYLICRMASLALHPEFKHHMFVDSSDISHIQALEDLLGELPTPPLSPDHADGMDRSQLSETTTQEVDVGESILHQMMASSEELLAFDSQTSSSSSEDLLNIDPNILLSSPQALLQDCMWNCDAYEP